MFCLFSLISLLVIPGICSEKWEILHINKMKCVLKGSTTYLSATYKYPVRLTVTEIFWTVYQNKTMSINLLNHPDYRDRVQYFKQDKTFSLKLSNVRREDEGRYSLRIITTKDNYLFFPGIELRVTDLRVEIPEEVVEKDSPVLVCNSSCNLSNRTNFTWYKNGESLSESAVRNRLFLESVSSDDTGNYSCAATDQKHLPSPAVTLSVRYPPRSVSVSVSPSGEIVEGDSVTLNCNSDSNPPALNFSWFKGETLTGSGRIYSISNISSDHIGEYKCKSINEHGEKYSDAVKLSVMYPPRSVSVSVSPSGEIMEGDSVTLNCSSDSNPPALNFIWFKGEKLTGSGRIYSISNISSDHSGEYKCRSINEHGEKYSDAVKLNVMYPPRSVSVSVSPSREIVEGDSVTLNCNSDSNPPALNFSWFKEDETSSFGSGQRIWIWISSFSSRFSGRFSCEAHNKYGSQRSASVSLAVKEESSRSSITVTVGITAAAVVTVMLMLVVWLWIRRKRVTPSEEQNQRGSRQHQTVESPEDAYMTLDLMSRCSEYDTLDNMKRSCDADEPEDQDSTYYNIVKL